MSVVAARLAPVTHDGFITETEAGRLGTLLERCLLRPDSPHLRRDAHMTTIYDQELFAEASAYEASLLSGVIDSVVLTIQSDWGPNRLECALGVLMRPHSMVAAHADAEREDGSPNHTPQRTAVGLLYLRQPAAGGVLRVWDALRPQDEPGNAALYPALTGRLVTFPSTRRYMHDVTPVEAGERWNLAVWTQRP